MACILAVDDDPVFSALLGHVLLSEGHVPIVVNSALAALRALATGAGIDMVLTDLMMPGVTGVELIKTLRAAYPSLPIIAISSGGLCDGIDLVPEARKLLGADGVTPKAGCTIVLGVLIHRALKRAASVPPANSGQAVA